ncbi:MAG TPA: cytochrome c family protein [Alphaproteobacteria bacterium]
MIQRILAFAAAAGIAIAAAAPAGAADLEAGEKVFKKCKACHTIEADGKNKIGPNLHGVLGREAGTMEGFKYSKAMAEAGITWDEDRLRQYLADPKAYIEGNKMAFPGLKDEADRENVIAYIKQESGE